VREGRRGGRKEGKGGGREGGGEGGRKGGKKEGGGREKGKAGGLDDAVFGQVAELHVSEGLPWADHCDVCSQSLHPGNVVSESLLSWLGGLALEGPCCPLLELGRSLLGRGGAGGCAGQGTSCRGRCVHLC